MDWLAELVMRALRNKRTANWMEPLKLLVRDKPIGNYSWHSVALSLSLRFVCSWRTKALPLGLGKIRFARVDSPGSGMVGNKEDEQIEWPPF